MALLLGRKGTAVDLLVRHPGHFDGRENRRYLPGHPLPDSVRIATSGDPVDLLVMAVPSAEYREALAMAPAHAQVCVASKGLEPTTGGRLTEITPGAGVLSGPNLAVEVARGVPTVALAAFADLRLAQDVADLFSGPTFRVSATTDVAGVELAGALKNVLAVGAGISDGLGFGDNTKGAFLSRGLMEIARLGKAFGAVPETFLGPAGAGDLFATAASGLSRNHRLGEMLGRGKPLGEALREIGQVVEGVPTARAARKLAAGIGEFPVLATVADVLDGVCTPVDGVKRLMERA